MISVEITPMKPNTVTPSPLKFRVSTEGIWLFIVSNAVGSVTGVDNIRLQVLMLNSENNNIHTHHKDEETNSE